jgi:hypothetical protein
MANTIVNYEGTITMTPQRAVRPTSVEEIQEVLRDVNRYPGPVRAMGSCHSLTSCFATSGTIIDMRGMDRVQQINTDAKPLRRKPDPKSSRVLMPFASGNSSFLPTSKLEHDPRRRRHQPQQR